MNEPYWNQSVCDPYNHIGLQVIADVRRSKIIQRARVGTNLDDCIVVSRHPTADAILAATKR